MELSECYGKSEPFYRLLLVSGIQWQVAAALFFLCGSICVTSGYKVKDHVCNTEDKGWKHNIHKHSGCIVNCAVLNTYCLLQNVTEQYKKRLFALACEKCVNIKVSLCVCMFVLFTGFSVGQPGFLSLWHTQQSFLLYTLGEWTRQHNGYHLGIMRTSSMKWSCRAWQVRTMGDISGHQRELWVPAAARVTEGDYSLQEGETIM